MDDLLPDGLSAPTLGDFPASMPDVSAGDYQTDPTLSPLDPRHITVERITGWIVTAVISAILLTVLAVVVVSNWPPGLGTAITAACVLVVVVGLSWLSHYWPPIEYQRCRYRVDTSGLEIYRGVVWRSVINVPCSRIQHTDVKQGPLQRRYELGTLVVHTAGTQFASVELEGLAYDDALRLRDELIQNGTGDDAV